MFLERLNDIASPAPRFHRPKHRDDDPRDYVDGLVESLDPELRSKCLVATLGTLEDASRSYRFFALHVLQYGESPNFYDAFVELLSPAFPDWVHDKDDRGGSSMSSMLFDCLTRCGTGDERLVERTLALSEFPENRRRRLAHFTCFHVRTHGLLILREHLANNEALEPGRARTLGGRYARDAPEYLLELAESLRSYTPEVREKFAEGAALRLDSELLQRLRQTLRL